MKELTCLSEDVIQQWIDGELSTIRREQVHEHLNGCEECRDKVQQQQAWALAIKKALTTEEVEIPEFVPVNEVPATRRFPLWLKIAAVAIPAFCIVQLLLHPEKTYQPSHDELLMYQSLSDMDANAAFQERVIVTTATNQEGEIVEFEIH